MRKAEEDRGKQPKRMVKVGTTGKRRRGELVEVKRDKEEMFKIRRKRRCESSSKRGKDIERN